MNEPEITDEERAMGYKLWETQPGRAEAGDEAYTRDALAELLNFAPGDVEDAAIAINLVAVKMEKVPPIQRLVDSDGFTTYVINGQFLKVMRSMQ